MKNLVKWFDNLDKPTQMDQETLFAHMLTALNAANASLKEAEAYAGKLGRKLGYSKNDVGKLVASLSYEDLEGEEKVVEGIFDGQNMIGPKGKVYTVPSNYASKSKLVEGDLLKLTVAANGAFIFKQIEPIPRKMAVGHLVLDGSQYQVLIDGKSYNVLYASVTFYKARVGDSLTIIIPTNIEGKWAAIENVLPREDSEELELSE